MIYSWLIYLYLVLFLLLVSGFWTLNFIGLPGNWLIIGTVAAWIGLGPDRFQFSWSVWFALVALGLLGEGVEFAASVLGTKKMGGSTRGATLSVVGSIAGGIAGLIVGIPVPIPVVGMLVGSVLFASIGAMTGAVIGEKWVGKPTKESIKVGGAAFVGRMLGTAGKITVGSVMVVVSWLAPFVFVV